MESTRQEQQISLRSQARTLLPALYRTIRPQDAPASRPWSCPALQSTHWDESGPEIELTGDLAEHPDARDLCIVVHGLGGATNSAYCIRAARATYEAGMASLRVSMRGADFRGKDIYHAGLYEDLQAAANSLACDYDRIFLWGYSLGGHVTLHAAAHSAVAPSPFAAIVAVCPPLDLEPCQAHLDQGWFYRSHLLRGLRPCYQAWVREGRNVRDVDIDRIRTLWEWDREVVCPRFGFEGPKDYYEQVSIRDRYAAAQVPTLILGSQHDPMIPFSSIEPHLRQTDFVSHQFWPHGGHSFRTLGNAHWDGSKDLEAAIAAWFLNAER